MAIELKTFFDIIVKKERGIFMRKIGTLLLALIMALGIFAAPVSAAQETSSDVKLIYNVGENYKHPADERFAVSVRSVDELALFLERYPFSQKIAYDEAFFAENTLLFVRLPQSTEKMVLTSVSETDTAIMVELETEVNDSELSGFNIYDETLTWALMFERDIDLPEKEVIVNSEKVADASYETITDRIQESLINVTSFSSDIWDSSEGMYVEEIYSTDELEQFFDKYPTSYPEKSANKLREKYDEAFFEENMVVFDCMAYSERFISAVTETEDAIEIEVVSPRTPPEPVNIPWVLVIEIDFDMSMKEIIVNSKKIAEAPYKTITFADVPSDAWYADAVKYVSWDRNIMNGSSNLFNPQGTMTRGMLVTVLWRLAGEPEAETNVFTDVPEGKYYTEAVNWAAENGIVTGSGDNKFNPEGAITREQLVTILYRMAVKKGTASGTYEEFSGFEDDEAVRGYAVEAMKWAVSEGIITGSENGGKLYLNPQKNSTRAQVAAILMRYLK